MGAIVIRTRFDEGTESAEVATSGKRINTYNNNIIKSELYKWAIAVFCYA